jgi:lysophospholipase L1-like esterase
MGKVKTMIRWLKDRHTSPALLLAAAIFLANAAPVSAQAQAPNHKVPTPEQKDFQAEMAQYLSQHEALSAKAQAALEAEMDREKKGDCPDARTTFAVEQCLSTEIEKTQANYAIFAGAIRAMLALSVPTMPGEPPSIGPTGASPTATEDANEFDQLEAESKQYRDHAAAAAYNQYRGGTEAPVAEAQQRLLRLHFQEVAFIYESLLSNR